VDEKLLEPGDRITIGGTILAYYLDEAKSRWVGKKLGGYEIVEFLGKGGMGAVYKGRQISMERFVALKILNEKLVNDKDFIERFLQEAKSAGRLNHPNIIQVIDIDMSDGTYFFSMEYVDGPTVGRILKEKGQLLVDESLEIVASTAEALHFAHKNALIHRDIKPDNVMINSEGQVKLADLGLARNPDDDMVDLVDGKKIVWGTPSYMSPEQAMGHKLDGRSDLYSLGATWYQMLTGNAPFKGKTGPEIMQQHISSRVPNIHKKNDQVPKEVSTMIEKLLRKRAEDRYQSGEELSMAVNDYRRDVEADDNGDNSSNIFMRFMGDWWKKEE
ncbi:MAG: serine/threonine-protein kinase, partial [Planctomycetota bacterium]|nr:serine/threonine-protein kinase [Planctomycetota bacterium]